MLYNVSVGYINIDCRNAVAQEHISVASPQQRVVLTPTLIRCICVTAFMIGLLFNRSVKNVVLCNEDDVKSQADICQSKLDWVARQPAPVSLKRAVYDELKQAQDASTEVQQLLCDRPANSRLASEVGKCLRNVFPDGENQLDVLDGVDLDLSASLLERHHDESSLNSPRRATPSRCHHCSHPLRCSRQ